jgi:Fe-S-cluster containining protein
MTPMPSSTTNAEWFADGLHFSCTQCGNCCSGPPGYVWFTEQEGKAIAEYLHRDEGEFLRAFAVMHNGQWSLREVKRGPSYDCIFLDRDDSGKALCSIYPVRPRQCRTWPFWPELLKSRDAWKQASRRCPGMDVGTFFPVEQIRIIRDSNPK